MWWCALLAVGFAQDDVDDGDDIDIAPDAGGKTGTPDWTKTPAPRPTISADDDDGMRDFAAEELKKAPPPVRWHVDPTGATPFGDTFDIQVLAFTDALVMAELPVMVATDRASFLAEHPGGLVLEVKVSSGQLERVVTEHVTAASVYEFAPTLVFVKVAVPNPAPAGDLRFLVRTQELPPPPPAPEPGARPKPPAPPPPAAPFKDRYARTTVFLRPQKPR